MVEHTQRAGPAEGAESPAVVAMPRGWASADGLDPHAEFSVDAAVHTYDRLDAPADWSEVVALVPGDHRVDAAVLDRMPALRVVSVDGTGVWNQVDVPAATARGVAVCNVREYAADAVAEFTIGAMIALCRQIPAAADAVRRGEWAPDSFLGLGLRNRTLGLVGFGSIGARVAELANAFGMRVLCTTGRAQAHPDAPANVTFVGMADLLDRCDVLSLHARLDHSSRGLIGAAELARLRPGAFLVNTARGGLVDEDALVAALRSGRLAGAALDVTEPEPVRTDSPLLEMDSVILTPHIAAGTAEARRDVVSSCLRNVDAFLRGAPTSVVNPEALL